MFDLVIIGASAASFPAAVYASRRHLNFVMITKDIGGELALSGEVNNWPGVIKISGYELAKQMHEHAKSYDTKIEEGLNVKEIKQNGKTHIVIASDASGNEKTFETKTVLIASGIHPRELSIPGEQKFKSKGITYCTVCDGPLFKGKTTATIGSGNSALESALMMADISEKVYIVTKYPENNLGGFPKGESILVKKLKEKSNVEIIYNSDTTEVKGDNMVSGIVVVNKENNETTTIAVGGVMVHIGMIPNSDFVDCVTKNKQKEIEINLKCETSTPGIFAAGDVTNVPYKQIVIASGQGVTAALSAIEYLNKFTD
ncbi:MAG: FAD-dependent oxidoreductase [bacterium]|nr:FAD-dependent oxidoreductase [bacterium]